MSANKRAIQSTISSFLFIFIMSLSRCSFFAQRTAGVGSFTSYAFAFHSGYHNSRPFAAKTDRSYYRRWIASTTVHRKKGDDIAGIFTSLFSAPPTKEEVDPGTVEGTDYRIVKYPHPSLRAENVEVILPDEQESITKLSKDMLKIMYAAQGVGLAAPQIGVNKRLM